MSRTTTILPSGWSNHLTLGNLWPVRTRVFNSIDHVLERTGLLAFFLRSFGGNTVRGPGRHIMSSNMCSSKKAVAED